MLRPLNDFVIVERDQHEGKIGSIIIPDTAKDPLTQGRVLGIGPGKVVTSKLADEMAEAIAVLDADGVSDAASAALGVLMGVESRLRKMVPTVKKGDRVLFGKYSGHEAKIQDEDGNDRDCVLMTEGDIYGVIEE